MCLFSVACFLLLSVVVDVNLFVSAACPKTQPLANTECVDGVHPNGGSLEQRPCEYQDVGCNVDDNSAYCYVCGCIDYEEYGLVRPETSAGTTTTGPLWACLRAHCRCPAIADDVVDGAPCNVTAVDFFRSNFVAPYRISGSPGCGNDRTCLCAPVYGDNDPIGAWVWQCGLVEYPGDIDSAAGHVLRASFFVLVLSQLRSYA